MILVSACLTGKNCKYNGGNNLNMKLVEFLKDKEYILVCPELQAGLGVPRKPVEIVDNKIKDKEGIDYTNKINKGIDEILEKIDLDKVEYAILQSRSPSCGVLNVYDGTFSGKVLEGQGCFAKRLIEKNIKVFDIEKFNFENN